YLSLSLSFSCEQENTPPPPIFIFGLRRQRLPTVAATTTRRHLGRHRFRWNHHTSYFPFHPTATSIRRRGRRKQPRNIAVLTDFYPTFALSFSLISPPNLTSKVFRPRIHSRRDPLRNVSLECYKHYPMYLPSFGTWIRTLEILGIVGTQSILDGMLL
ncbi:ZWICHEL kinesin-like calmodulin-binding protein, partial [Prunus dulcis]